MHWLTHILKAIEKDLDLPIHILIGPDKQMFEGKFVIIFLSFSLNMS